MALSIPMGKLDAICAKLKQGQPPVEKNSLFIGKSYGQKDNNDNITEETASNTYATSSNSCDNYFEQDTAAFSESSTSNGTADVESGSTAHFPSADNTQRKRKRKTTTPRSIVHLQEAMDKVSEKDELDDYIINNPDVSFPPEERDYYNSSSDNESDYKSSRLMIVESEDEVSFGVESECSNIDNSTLADISCSLNQTADSKLLNKPSNDSAPLDLSFVKCDRPLNSGSPKSEPTAEYKDTAYSSESDASSNDGITNFQSVPVSDGRDAVVLQHYAESTMNELLSIYGFSGSVESLTRNVSFKYLNELFHSTLAADNKAQPKQLPVQSTPPEDESGKISPTPEKKVATLKVPKVSPGTKNTDKFTGSAAYINACFNRCDNKIETETPLNSASSSQRKSLLPDYSKYLKRFINGKDCGKSHCMDLAYREHFHCMDCNDKVFLKKEEMVRHFKWHKKRDDSLQHGFMRYSPMDDCTEQFGNCTHNGRQTHYHCLQHGCEKVYVSTSDVQMHANYHRKDSAIMLEGFQRFRATEDCGTQKCAFYGQRTTHFHCCRPFCNFTFKNKADMEKHKTYHQKDEVLGKDGFKKFMKYEKCNFGDCRYSKVSNHIHCIRPGCDYVLHSTAQLYSHKRKHERREFENAFRRFQEGKTLGVNPLIARQFKNGNKQPVNLSAVKKEVPESMPVMSMSLPITVKQEPSSPTTVKREADSSPCDSPPLKKMKREENNEEINGSFSPLALPLTITPPQVSESTGGSSSPTDMKPLTLNYASHITSPALDSDLSDSLNLPVPSEIQETASPDSSSISSPETHLKPPALSEKKQKDESWQNYLIRYTANDPCAPHCEFLYKDHYHCKVSGCTMLFRAKDQVREHSRYHYVQDQITPVAFRLIEKLQSCIENCQYSLKTKHYHCLWTGCAHVLPFVGRPFERLEHYKIHEDARAIVSKLNRASSKGDPDNHKRRGRPPKYPRDEIVKVPKPEINSIEVPKAIQEGGDNEDSSLKILNGFRKYEEGEPCPDELCIYFMHSHYHCARPRCHHATDRIDVLTLHAKDFHNFITILEGFEFFDRNVNCRRPHCHNNKSNRHFHCVRPRCDYSFVRHNTMLQHEKKHKIYSDEKTLTLEQKDELSASFNAAMQQSPPVFDNNTSKAIVKASGTFYPIQTSDSQPSTVVTVSGQNQMSPPPLLLPVPITPAISGMTFTQPILNPKLVTTFPSVVPSMVTSPSSVQLALLLQQKANNMMPEPNWTNLRNRMHYSLHQNCGRPFCKLKKKDHYHCFDCNQAFSDPARLRVHIGKHGIKFKKLEFRANAPVAIAPRPEMPTSLDCSNNSVQDEATDLSMKVKRDDVKSQEVPELSASSSLTLKQETFSSMIAIAQGRESVDIKDNLNNFHKNVDISAALDMSVDNSNEKEKSDLSPHDSNCRDDSATNGNKVLSRKSGRKRTLLKHDDFVGKEGKEKVLNSRGGKDDSIPQGYVRVRFNEDCTYSKCAYRQSVTHFHCLRSDCGYGFSDKTRLIQHSLRHERIDSITGGEFLQYRAGIPCDRDDCELSSKASHFHCLKCTYQCNDSSKVLAHRKHHAKLDNIISQGFHKFSLTEDCKYESCTYRGKQTHYHCTQGPCSHAVLGPAQMSPHRAKHIMDGTNA